MEKSWQGAHLSTGASREAPVDNESFFNNPEEEHSWHIRLMLPYLRRHGEEHSCQQCLARGTGGQSVFFNNPDDEQSWNTRLMHPYLRRHSEEHTCQQMPRARHLWTLPGFQLPSDGKSWRIGLFGELESK